ncbi:MAG: SUMF1/EgtB/PvdO family nonheme iron enzyme [Candidatus Competibacteraceae bacterium]|nr:SUMF1/EgtB/PvdO family nonheme iron enzyme [Candidatus Competibacteraceae bacterium]
MDYAAWLSARMGKLQRLPAELEWAYAAHAGAMTSAPDSDGQVREWTCSEYRREYEGQEQHCASRLPEAVAIHGSDWRGAPPIRSATIWSCGWCGSSGRNEPSGAHSCWTVTRPLGWLAK